MDCIEPTHPSREGVGIKCERPKEAEAMTSQIRITSVAVAALVAVIPFAASAQSDASGRAGLGGWSVVGTETVSGRPTIDVQAGWPSTTFGYTFGLSPTSDVSLRLGLLYGYEGTTTSQFGLSFYAPLRFQLMQSKDFRLLFHVDPGLKLYTTSSAQFGLQFPVGVVMGFPIRPDLEVGVALDFAMTLLVTGRFAPQFFFGPLVGPYVEYHPAPNVSVGLNTRFGAAIDAYSSHLDFPGGTSSNFAFTTQLVLGYRMP
jgi:hypothetical protein